nr:MAG TPA: hypothetical protein [Caudoviricetes sp.]
MNKELIKERFNQVVGTIGNLKDISIEDNGAIIAYGMHTDETHTIVYYENENVVKFFEDGNELIKINEDSPIILMFDYILGFANSLYYDIP